MTRVAMLAPISWRVPPRHYGPWELVTSLLTEGLVKAGLDVTLFATQDSITTAKLAGVCPRPLSEDPELNSSVWSGLHIAEVFEHASEFDIIHNQFDYHPLPFSRLVSTPVVTTIHGFSSPSILPTFEKYATTGHYVAISDADRSPRIPYIATIHHGIDIDQFPLHDPAAEHLVFFGRIHPDKGVVEAIEVANRVGRPLILAGIIHDEEYFTTQVQPRLDGDRIQYVGSVGPQERDHILGDAFALLHLINFAEPFGLSMIEAMAFGTPVIAFPRGSVPEIVKNGTSGYIVNSVDEAVVAVQQVLQLSRTIIRAYAVENFSSDRMVREYIDVYQKVLQERG